MSESLRLLVLNCEYPPLGGGAATATENILSRLRALGVMWDLVTASPSDDLRLQENGGCTIHFLPVGKKSLHYWTNRELIRYAVAARRYCAPLARGRRFDVCHAFFTLPAGALALGLRRMMPFVVSLRGSDVPGFSGRYGLFHRLTLPLTRHIWRAAAAVVANSEELKLLAAESDPQRRIEVIPNGVDTRQFTPGEFRPGGRRILVVARLVPRKDVETALRAVAALRRRACNVSLEVVGDGPEAARIEELARTLDLGDSLRMRRYVPRSEMPAVYRAADVFFLTSRREGMSNTVLEALASGLPVVASPQALSGIDFPPARLVAPGDGEAAAAALASLLEDDGARRDAGIEARAAAVRYDWLRVAEDYLELYRRVLSIAKGGGR